MKILVVDDDAMVARCVARLLVSLGHEVVVASGMKAASLAFDFFDIHGHFDMIFSDYRMPDKTGDAVLTEIDQRNSGIACILSTGGTGEVSIEQVIRQCPAKTVLLKKPYSLGDLCVALDQAMRNVQS